MQLPPDTDPRDESRIARDPALESPRTALRRALLDARRRAPAETRRAANDALLARLADLLGAVAGATVALYWPVRGEPLLEPLPARWLAAGARLALPCVVAPDAPLRFLAWCPGDATVPGAMGIPVPAVPVEVRPDRLVVPCLGFDDRCFRLGYGGGFYDRSLAALDGDGGPPVFAVGVAWDEARIEGFAPLPTDRPLDAIVSPARSFRPGGPAVR
jgi:5-formyltetrahydrofolate cyclo-ligase